MGSDAGLESGAAMINIRALRSSIRLLELAAIRAALGRESDALRDVGLAVELLQGCVRDDYSDACATGLIEIEVLFNSERDTRPSDDGEPR